MTGKQVTAGWLGVGLIIANLIAGDGALALHPFMVKEPKNQPAQAPGMPHLTIPPPAAYTTPAPPPVSRSTPPGLTVPSWTVNT